MTAMIEQAADTMFVSARTHRSWTDKQVPEDLLHKIYATAIMGPTCQNTLPMRIVFVASPAAKAKLLPALKPGNVAKTMTAPVTAIFAYDRQFYELLTKTLPHVTDARAEYAGKPALIEETAFRNATLQAAYFMVIARAYRLDCGPMSGFDQGVVDAAFFADGRCKSNFLCNLGYGLSENLRPRSPRLTFAETCTIL